MSSENDEMANELLEMAKQHPERFHVDEDERLEPMLKLAIMEIFLAQALEWMMGIKTRWVSAIWDLREDFVSDRFNSLWNDEQFRADLKKTVEESS